MRLEIPVDPQRTQPAMDRRRIDRVELRLVCQVALGPKVTLNRPRADPRTNSATTLSIASVSALQFAIPAAERAGI